MRGYFGKVTQQGILAAWQVLEGKPVKGEDVSKIIIRGVERPQCHEWEMMLDVQFSIPYTLALAITVEQPGPGWYTTERFEIKRYHDAVLRNGSMPLALLEWHLDNFVVAERARSESQGN